MRREILLLASSSLLFASCCGIAMPGKPTGTDPISVALSRNMGNADEAIKNVTEAIDKITPQDERALGQASSFAVISESGGLLLDASLVQYVNEIGNAVAQQGHRDSGEGKKPRTKARRFFFGILNDDSMNAYSLPGGYIFVTRGLVENLSSESELAWVLAHETVHVDKEHNLSALKAAALGKSFGHEADSFLRSATGREQAGDAADLKSEKFFGFIAGKFSDIALKLGLDMSQEAEADKVGLEYATAAGYDAKGAERVLTLLAANPGRSRSFLKQHATPDQRLAALADDIAKKGDGGKVGAQRFEERGWRGVQTAVAQAAAAKATPTPAPAPAP